jgi:AmiR/NasT family two-component response regulator
MSADEAAARIAALERALNDALAHVAQLEEALASRDVIGQAKGVLMERHHTGAEEAFAELVQLSQHLNIKLRQVAEVVAGQPERNLKRR